MPCLARHRRLLGGGVEEAMLATKPAVYLDRATLFVPVKDPLPLVAAEILPKHFAGVGVDGHLTKRSGEAGMDCMRISGELQIQAQSRSGICGLLQDQIGIGSRLGRRLYLKVHLCPCVKSVDPNHCVRGWPSQVLNRPRENHDGGRMNLGVEVAMAAINDPAAGGKKEIAR